MSIMNMPPLPYLKRIPGLDMSELKPAYTDATVWDNFDPGTLTLCSPDPQAIRPPDEKINVLQVTLPTNFKVRAVRRGQEHRDPARAARRRSRRSVSIRRRARSSCR